ncbi:MAG: hypothetical protein HeimC3_22440 [Candidatus Heimdallarchaeota archaeon LC_3]|nr:MAG: hypothetical protein HeimC3_22440 [Candidatus Heimdallarchaeota archaeon LC_3]
MPLKIFTNEIIINKPIIARDAVYSLITTSLLIIFFLTLQLITEIDPNLKLGKESIDFANNSIPNPITLITSIFFHNS